MTASFPSRVTNRDSFEPGQAHATDAGDESRGRRPGTPGVPGPRDPEPDTETQDAAAQVAEAQVADAQAAGPDGPESKLPVPDPDEAGVEPDRMEEAVKAAAEASEAGNLGQPGKPLNRRSPFFVGLAATAGVAVTIGLIEIVIHARSMLILIGLALFVAAGLDPGVSWLTRHGVRRWLAVIIVVVAVFAVIAGFLAAAIPPLASQTTALASQLPHYAKRSPGPQLRARQAERQVPAGGSGWTRSSPTAGPPC